MKQQTKSNTSTVTTKQLLDFYKQRDKIENQKKQSQKQVMEQEFQRATGGKAVILSNLPKQ